MRRVATTRREDIALLMRRPPVAMPAGAHTAIDPVAQLRALSEMVDEGLLSVEEYERQRRLVGDG
jgi:hypothetical protein